VSEGGGGRFRDVLGAPEVRTSLIGTFLIMLGYGILAPVLPNYARSFGVDLKAVGVLVAAFSVTRLAVDPFTGVILDALGERRAVTLGAAVVGLTSALAAVAPTFELLVVFRGAGGAGSAVFFAGLISYLLRTVPSDRIGRVMSAWYGSFNVGIIAGEPLGGLFAGWLGPASTLWIYGVMCLVSATVFSRTIRDRPTAPASARRSTGLRRLRWDRPLLTVLLANGAYAWVVAAVYNTLIPLFGTERVHLSLLVVGGGLAIASVTEFAALFPAGRATDRIGRKAVLVPSYVLLAIAVALWPLATTPVRYVVGLGLFGLTTGYAGVPQTPMLSDLTDEQNRSTAVAVFRFVGDLGFVLGPLAAGVSADRLGYGPAFALASVPVVVALAFALSIRETKPTLPRTGEAPGL